MKIQEHADIFNLKKTVFLGLSQSDCKYRSTSACLAPLAVTRTMSLAMSLTQRLGINTNNNVEKTAGRFRNLTNRLGITQPEPKLPSIVSPNHVLKKIETVFRVGGKLGDGASGRVFTAIHKASGQTYAVKEMSRRDKYNLELFEQEIQILNELSGHPNILELKNLCAQSSVFFCVFCTFLRL